MKIEKGITLIALVITIIILLILAGITINLTLGEHGILNMAKEAGKNYQNAADYEKNEIDTLYNNVIKNLENNDTNYSRLVDKANVGDYVAYNPIDGVIDQNILSYTSPVGTGMSHGNGCSKTSDGVNISEGQTFTANSNIKWRVLSTNKTTGEVVLISEEPIQTDEGREFYMKGAIGYLYAEQELNEICKIYGYGKGADTSKVFNHETGYIEEEKETRTIKGSGSRSIDIKDINNITGYKTVTGTSSTHTIFYPTKTTKDGKSLTTKSTTDENSSLYKGEDYITDKSSTIYKILFTNKTNSDYSKYWIANKCTGDSTSTGVNFFIQMVYDGMVATNIVLASWPNQYEEIANFGGVRPIIHLKTNIQTSGQDENGAWKII